MQTLHHGPALVRLSCERHLGEFDQPAPCLRDLVWCKSCGRYRVVTLIIMSSHKESAMCGKRGKWYLGSQLVEVVCTEPIGHPRDQHYDRTFSAYFPDSIGKPRRMCKANPGRALARHEEELVFTAL